MQRLLRMTLEHARLVSLLGLVGAAGWAFVAWMTLDMGHPLIVLMMPMSAVWEPQTVLAVFIMWALMMVAMMLPSAAPMIATFDGLQKRNTEEASPSWRTSGFLAGYLMVWAGFSALATALQWLLQSTALVTPMGESASPLLTSALLAIAGLYQFSPLKQMCLRYCRSPIGFLLMEWRPGAGGAWAMGLKHGAFCLGCCWAVMLLLFVAGVMNPIWIVALTGVVAVEKLAPYATWTSALMGTGFLAASLFFFLMG